MPVGAARAYKTLKGSLLIPVVESAAFTRPFVYIGLGLKLNSVICIGNIVQPFLRGIFQT